MTKEDALKVILKVKLKPTVIEAFDALVEVEEYLIGQEPFSYQDLQKFIQSKMPTKMGGVYIQVSKAMDYLKNELRTIKKQSKP